MKNYSEQDLFNAAVKMYLDNNFADVENAAVECLINSLSDGDPYKLLDKVSKLHAQRSTNNAEVL